MFIIQGDPQKQINKLNKQQLKAFQRVSAGVLNTQAFTARTGFQETLKKDNTIRSPGLLKKGTHVTMAKSSDRLNRQSSKAGSVKTARHDAWEAINEGKRTNATLFTDDGRAGSSNSRMPQKTAKAGQNVTELGDLGVTGSGNEVIKNYLLGIRGDKARRKKSFYLPRKYKNMRRGIYKFVGGRIGGAGRIKGMLHGADLIRLSTPKQSFTPKKTNWNIRTIKREINEGFISRAWKKQMKRELGKIKKR
jgi:hypothetical protein